MATPGVSFARRVGRVGRVGRAEYHKRLAAPRSGWADLGGVRCLNVPASTSQIESKVRFGPFGAGGRVLGAVEKGWEPVREAFEENFALNLELGAQLAIYKGEELMVDLAGHSPAQPGYTAETLQCVFSCGKNVEAIAVAMLVSRGAVSYNDLVCNHWPEFAQNGKESITIADVMRHEGGVPFLLDPAAMDDKSKDIILSQAHLDDVDLLEAAFAAAPCVYDCVGHRRTYHSVSRGWLVSAIVRRVDPRGRTLGQFIRQDISDVLGISYFCGISAAEQANFAFAGLTQISKPYTFAFEALPALLGVGCPIIATAIKRMLQKNNPAARVVCDWMGKIPDIHPRFLNTVAGREAEISSAGMPTNARSMAKLNACMANGGALGGVRLMSEAACEESMSEFTVAHDAFFGCETSVSVGGFGDLTILKENMVHRELTQALDGFLGWGGWGGSLSLWHPEKRIAVSYVPNAMENSILGGPRTARIFSALRTVI
mmetsp:Transcript_17447/g.60928  ORF Transcript_17447/g.60928 Transcript_17447/m.60928 type:complete len:487 (+) Transcript_17447:71-1531(+)